MGEANLQKTAMAACRNRGCLSYKVHAEGVKGFPDLIIFKPGGASFLLELKSPTGKGRLSKIQQYRIDELRSVGVNVYVVANKVEIDVALSRELDFARL